MDKLTNLLLFFSKILTWVAGIATCFVISAFHNACSQQHELPLSTLKLPQGFSISVFARVNGAREMALGNKNTVFVGSINQGKVYAIIPDKKSPNQNRVVTIASNLKMPNGVAFYKNALYVAEMNRVIRFNNIEDHLNNPPKPEVILDNLPSANDHGWRYIHFGPDHQLYIGIGAPCNVCLRKDFPFATIMRMDPDGKNFSVYARGIRNSVGFDWDPNTHDLWFTDNGRDLLGDNLPPDELNHAPKANLHFGFPFCHGKNIADPEYGKDYPCSQFIPPVVELPAHVAALGMIFYSGNMFPKEYLGQIFIAEHGSWNRSKKIGYQVVTVNIHQASTIKSNPPIIKPFVTGWLQNDEYWGRPVDLLLLRDGSLLVSDDFAGAIYRIVYQQNIP